MSTRNCGCAMRGRRIEDERANDEGIPNRSPFWFFAFSGKAVLLSLVVAQVWNFADNFPNGEAYDGPSLFV
eukprot:66411-Prymnesium_polylepis.1